MVGQEAARRAAGVVLEVVVVATHSNCEDD